MSFSLNKRFIVTGVPRSGTTFVCKKIAELQTVHMDPVPGYEPFGPEGGVLDEQQYLRRLERDNPNKIVGLKTWWEESYDLHHHLKSYDTIVVLRRDIHKVFLSYVVMTRAGFDVNHSSRNRPGAESIEHTDYSLKYLAHSVLKSYYYSEKMLCTFKLYFEDLSKDNPLLDEYFETKLDLDPGYRETQLTDYHPDPQRYLDILKDTALTMDHKNLPDYVRKKMHI
jgi:hypothetical protein